MARPTEAQIEAGRRKLRRQGMADAAVLLVARRFHPLATLENLGDALGLNVLEVQDAVRRFQALTRPQGPPPPRPGHLRAVDPTAGRAKPGPNGASAAVIAHLEAHGPVVDPAGRASSIVAAAIGYPTASVSGALAPLEAQGRIHREVRGRRTYRLELAAAEEAAG